LHSPSVSAHLSQLDPVAPRPTTTDAGAPASAPSGWRAWRAQAAVIRCTPD